MSLQAAVILFILWQLVSLLYWHIHWHHFVNDNDCTLLSLKKTVQIFVYFS